MLADIHIFVLVGWLWSLQVMATWVSLGQVKDILSKNTPMIMLWKFQIIIISFFQVIVLEEVCPWWVWCCWWVWWWWTRVFYGYKDQRRADQKINFKSKQPGFLYYVCQNTSLAIDPCIHNQISTFFSEKNMIFGWKYKISRDQFYRLTPLAYNMAYIIFKHVPILGNNCFGILKYHS